MRFAILGLAAALALGSMAQAQAPAAHAAYSSATLIGALLDNPATKAVLLKIIPEIVNNPMIEQGRDFPLAGIAQFEPSLTPAKLAEIDAALAKVPAAH